MFWLGQVNLGAEAQQRMILTNAIQNNVVRKILGIISIKCMSRLLIICLSGRTIYTKLIFLDIKVVLECKQRRNDSIWSKRQAC